MEIRTVGVVGLGTMGAGIAQVSVQFGFETIGREINDELGERGRATIDRYLSRGVEKGRMTEADRNAAQQEYKGLRHGVESELSRVKEAAHNEKQQASWEALTVFDALKGQPRERFLATVKDRLEAGD